MKKKPVGRPEKTAAEKVKTVSKCITFEEDTFKIMEDHRGDDPKSLYINNLIREHGIIF